MSVEDKKGNKQKKKYEKPRLMAQDHISRVTQKSSGRPDQAPPWGFKNPGGGGSGNLSGDGNESSSGGESGSLFDNPFDD